METVSEQPRVEDIASNYSRIVPDNIRAHWTRSLPKINYTETLVQPASEQFLFENRVLCSKQPEKVKQCYKQLRTQVLQKLMDNDWNSLAVLGLREGQGASLTAVNLAIGLAMDTRVSVLLVDLNLRSPAIHEFFDYMPSVGFQDYFLDLVDFPQLLFNPGIQRLVVLASEDRVEHSSEFLLSTKMSMLIEEIRNRYPNRIVIFDFPPLLDADDAIACRRYFDAALLVLKDGVTQRKDLSLASELLGDKSVLGTVLTGVGA